jgi:hypothetical protein
MEPELGRDATVAVVLIAAIVALAAGSVVLGIAALGTGALVLGAVALLRSRAGHTDTDSRAGVAGRSRFTGPQSH